ncbi:MAG: hypothetical protein GXO75_08240 [Calditrichaeota bacterium]|nr:hypothetical protein [Calditrichota bacterium]
MGELVKVTLRPGGMRTDVSENDLSNIEYQEVKNLKQDKFGKWVTCKGYKDILALSGADIRAAIEVTDDISGDRFILYQDGTSLKRLDWDQTNGYSNATPTTLTLPDDVTIDSNAVLKFFYYRGVVRITGASEPMWYGYIDRQRFYHNLVTIKQDTFESGTDGWFGNWANISQSSTYAFQGTYSLKIVQSQTYGYATSQPINVTVGKYYRVSINMYKDSNDDQRIYKVKIWKHLSSGTETIEERTFSSTDRWIKFTSSIFKAETNQIEIAVWPSDESTGTGTLYIDEVKVERIDADQVGPAWFLKKARIENEIAENYWNTQFDDVFKKHNTAPGTMYLGYFYIYDFGQYPLHEDMICKKTDSGFRWLPQNYILEMEPQKISLGIPTDLDERITGIAIVVGLNERITYVSEWGTPYDVATSVYEREKIPWYVVTTFDFTKPLTPIKYEHTECVYETATKDRIYIAAGNHTTKVWWENGYFYEGCKVTIEVVGGGRLDTTVIKQGRASSSYLGSAWYIQLADDVYPNLLNSDVDQVFDATFEIDRIWREDTNNNVYLTDLSIGYKGVEYHEFTGIPPGTKDISPNYRHHVVLNERAFVTSLEDEEEDVIRYSPEYQFDVFPNLNIIQTETGDFDKNLSIVKRDDRLMILKKRSISQVQFAGNQFYHDYIDNQIGLFAENGTVVIGNILYFMDREEVYEYTGVAPRPILANQMMQNIYKQYVDKNSFLAWDKVNNELWLFLNGRIFVYNPNRQEWYERDTDIDPIKGYFVDADGRFVVFNQTKFVDYSHNDSTFNESVTFSLKSRIIDNDSPYFWKKLKEIRIFGKGNKNLVVKVKDPQKTEYQKTLTPDATNEKEIKDFPKYLFKTMDLTVSAEAASTDVSNEIKKIELIIEKWNNM